MPPLPLEEPETDEEGPAAIGLGPLLQALPALPGGPRPRSRGWRTLRPR